MFPFGINPVQTEPLQIGDWGESTTWDFHSRLCPGTPMTFFTRWEDLPRYRAELDIENIRLADYKLDDSPVSGGVMGAAVP